MYKEGEMKDELCTSSSRSEINRVGIQPHDGFSPTGTTDVFLEMKNGGYSSSERQFSRFIETFSLSIFMGVVLHWNCPRMVG